MIKKGLLALALSIGILFIMARPVSFAQETPQTWVVVNMTGVNQSRYVVDRSGVDDSRYVVSTSVIEIGLHGITVYPISVNFGTLRASDIRASDSVFRVYNAGSTTLNVTIAVTGDWYGATGNWTHSDECEVGESTAGLRAIVEDGGSHTSIIVRKTEPYNYLVQDLAAGETVSFALELYTPTTLSDYSLKQNGIFIETSEE